MGCNKSCLKNEIRAQPDTESVQEHEEYTTIAKAVPVLTSNSVAPVSVTNVEDFVETTLFNDKNKSRWRGFEELKEYIDFVEHRNKQYSMARLTSKVIRHASQDINVYLRFDKYDEIEERSVEIEMKWDMFNKLEKDIQRLRHTSQPSSVFVLCCKTLQDMQDLVNSMKRFIPEMSTIETLLFEFLEK